jgi:hypothetical protein
VNLVKFREKNEPCEMFREGGWTFFAIILYIDSLVLINSRFLLAFQC